MKELSPQMLSLLQQKNMPKRSPILVRIFKEESELEVWKQDTTGRFELLKVYPICRWSGDLGPKINEGDRQAPEGFYTITPGLMNPNSNYYLAINTGFPNAYDRANDRHGAFLMIHGDCSSRGCYAMTDEQIGEIYSLARESFLGGQPSFQIQAYPFRMTPANLARHRTNPHLAFWKMLKIGNDHFEATHLEPKVDVCDKHYVFDAQQPPNGSEARSRSIRPANVPAYVVNPQIARAGAGEAARRRGPVRPVGQSQTWTVAPIHSGLDGGMNRVFLAQVGGSIPPARVPPPGANGCRRSRRRSQSPTTASQRRWRARFRRLLRLEDAGRGRRCGDSGARLGAGRDRHARRSQSRAPNSPTVAEAKPKLDLRKSDTAKPRRREGRRQRQQVAAESQTRRRSRKPTPQRRHDGRRAAGRAAPAASTAAGADCSNLKDSRSKTRMAGARPAIDDECTSRDQAESPVHA